MTAAEQLVDLTLDGGWKVVERSKKQPSSGGHFSVPYIVLGADGRRHFLKAFDFSSAFEIGVDVISALQQLTAAFNHERDILEHCKSRQLSNVVVAVTHGYVQVPGLSPQEGTVYYLIFELAEGDVRCQVDVSKRLDSLWCLKLLDDVTLGLWQLHREAIAHQDFKPSNALLYGNGRCRIGDFGRSSRRGRAIWIDDLDVAGDRTYAPPELLYSYLHPDFVARRIGSDLYLLGNFAAFLFSGINLTPAIFARLDSQFHPKHWGGTYEQVLPHIQRAFHEVVIELAPQIDPLVRDEIVLTIGELCNPDLEKRGHPRGIGGPAQYSLERYKSRSDLLLKRTAVFARTANLT